MKEGILMRQMYNTIGEEVCISRVFVQKERRDVEKDTYGYCINIECYDAFLTDTIKEEIEKLSAFTLSYAPEIQIYRHIKDSIPILEFRASQSLGGNYKINIINPFEEYMIKNRIYNNSLNFISKCIIERIEYLFSTFSVDNY